MDKIYFTDEQMSQLAPFEEQFERAVYANYCRAMTKMQKRLVASVFNEATGANVNADNNCPHCILELMQRAGRIYFATTEKIKAEYKARKEKEKEEFTRKMKEAKVKKKEKENE